MVYVLNILVIGLVLLIAYWWANQGLLSAILHLLCVLVAGAVTLAFWEPITVGLLLRGTMFDNFAWGVTMIALFALTLVGMRVLTDKLVPANADLPHWANLVFGFPVGLAASIITVGILFIGIGFVQSHQKLMGYYGYGRNSRGEIGPLEQQLWLPVHYWTTEFYGLLSVTSLKTGEPLRHRYPKLHWQSSLLRDTIGQGEGQLSLVPDGASVAGAWMCPELGRVALRLRFTSEAMDWGNQLALANSQIRLIGGARGGERPEVAHPVRWAQPTKDSDEPVIFHFDDPTHYISSVAGQETAEVVVEFPYTGSRPPRFVQIRGTRFDLPQVQQVARRGYEQVLASPAGRAAAPVQVSGGGPIAPDDIQSRSRLSGFVVSVNRVSGMDLSEDNTMVAGDLLVTSRGGASSISRGLRVDTIHEPQGTAVIQLDVSRGKSSMDLFSLEPRLADGDELRLVDADGATYSPIGYYHRRPDGSRVFLDPRRRVGRFGDLPRLPSSGTHELVLIFRVTAGVNIIAFQAGDRTLGTTDLIAGQRR